AFKDINLRVMLRLMEFGVPVGYSGHERGIAVSTCAAALGACIIERHITLDRTMPGPDHAASLEPPGLQKQIRDIRIIEVALGHDRRSPSRGELLTRVSLGKSLVAARDIMAGEIITWDMLSARSPGTGVSPQRALELIGKPAPRDFKAGERFLEADITGQQPADIVAASPFPWGASVRFHDAEAIASSLSPDLLEFHLTDMDLDRGVPEMPQFRQALSTHCPEYYHGKLLDICSADEATRQWSVSVVKRAADVARRLAELFPQSPRPLLVVHPGAMSYEDFLADPAPLAAAFARSVEELSGISDLQIVYENLPPFPWYFGGQWYGNYFCSPEDIVSACTELGIYICFDTSHAQLWCNHAQCNLIDFFDAVRAWIRHVHVADASGVDGEGLQIGMGEVDFHQLLPRLVSLGLPLLMEVWLGHHSGGEGFVVAVSRLTEIAQRVGLSRGA
ncbi:MAG: N-acetylneuraminate synthase family protein, partial [Armatimonadetes bacterium]|nr:N-acetylneuraminate synthase family protein [Armatimonadota bacterium]